MALDLKGAQQVLSESTMILSESLEPKLLLRKMKTRNALTSDDVTKISKEDTDSDRVDVLLQKLRRKSLTSYRVFMEVLTEERKDLYDDVKKIEAKHIITGNPTSSSSATAATTGSGMAIVTERDINIITQKVGLLNDQFTRIFQELDLKPDEVENAKKIADTKDYKIQASKVLGHWKATRGKIATKETLLEALKEAQCIAAMETLQEKHNW